LLQILLYFLLVELGIVIIAITLFLSVLLYFKIINIKKFLLIIALCSIGWLFHLSDLFHFIFIPISLALSFLIFIIKSLLNQIAKIVVITLFSLGIIFYFLMLPFQGVPIVDRSFNVESNYVIIIRCQRQSILARTWSSKYIFTFYQGQLLPEKEVITSDYLNVCSVGY
jgi:hypothetical protein